MIPAIFLLILVAVLFLALGLLNGSSVALIASIVASLLAAVALVVGVRQAAARRDATPGGEEPEAPRRRAGAASAHDSAPTEDLLAGDFAAADTTGSHYSAGSPYAADPMRQTDPVGFAPPVTEPDFPVPGDSGQVYVPRAAADQADVKDSSGSPAGRAADEAPTAYPVPDEPAFHDGPGEARADVYPGAGEHAYAAGARDARTHLTDESPADYAVASSTISDARSPGEDQSWRRPGAPEAVGESAVEPEADEFGEPDADDPDDEPLPQAVRPADAVLVARLDAEVVVVDGRPRYHVADCPHLVGRLTEPLPANEAVELGFSPCGLCRPVDRLVAAAAHH
ncbi:hypothetical protein [Actinoplanes sp. NPDC051851]|uniref:hypothetical protein n=1 Tax=Actinoplanes sp. NPDC051851 TaxID=3154753 RepID=UPI0034278605